MSDPIAQLQVNFANSRWSQGTKYTSVCTIRITYSITTTQVASGKWPSCFELQGYSGLVKLKPDRADSLEHKKATGLYTKARVPGECLVVLSVVLRSGSFCREVKKKSRKEGNKTGKTGKGCKRKAGLSRRLVGSFFSGRSPTPRRRDSRARRDSRSRHSKNPVTVSHSEPVQYIEKHQILSEQKRNIALFPFVAKRCAAMKTESALFLGLSVADEAFRTWQSCLANILGICT